MRLRKILIIPLTLLFLTGCSVVSNDNPGLFSRTRNYEMKIIKSEVNINTIDFIANKNISVQNLLDQSGTKYNIRGDGKLSELDGVIATASRDWNVYIDNVESDLDSLICNDCKVDWKYENINN